jgi:Rrf2 family protein
MLTREADYAIRALLRLAQLEGDRVLSTTRLAEEMLIPYRFLRRLTLKLEEHGFVESARGKHGGLRLARPAEAISLLDVIQLMHPESVAFNQCLVDEASCARSPECTVRRTIADIQAEVHHQLAGVTMATLAAVPKEE